MGMHGHAWACMGMHGACVRPIYASSRSSPCARPCDLDPCARARATSIDGRIDGRRSHRRWAHRWASMGRRWGVRARHTATTTTTTGDDGRRRRSTHGDSRTRRHRRDTHRRSDTRATRATRATTTTTTTTTWLGRAVGSVSVSVSI